MQVEGLAINDKGDVYLGFRGPNKRDEAKALIVKTRIEQIFPGDPEYWKPKLTEPEKTDESKKDENPKCDVKKREAKMSSAKFEVLPVYVGGAYRADQRGIVDLLSHNDEILILTNSISKYDHRTPAEIWRWKEEMGENPRLVSSGFYESPENILAKPEVLLLPEDLPAAETEGSAANQNSEDPADKKVFLFLDGENFGGGQRVYSRRELNLE